MRKSKNKSNTPNNANKKSIIGLIGSKENRNTVCNMLCKNGFIKLSINEKVEEFAKHLFSSNEMLANKYQILNETRLRAVKINPNYWLNMLLIDIPNDKKNVVIDDISEDEANNSYVQVYQIFSNKDYDKNDVYPKAKIIINDLTLFDQLFKKIESKSP